MNKKIFLAFLCAVTGTSAQAQSHVTLYGRFDAGGAYPSDKNGAGGIRFDDSAGMRNRLGFKGVEDPGGGAKIVFVLENGFRLVTGGLRQGGALFDRQAFTGLQNPTVTVAFGDQYDFIADYTTRFNAGAFGSNYVGHQGNFDRFSNERLKNSIKFAVGAQWMFGKFALIGNATNTTFKGYGRSATLRMHEVGLKFPVSSLWSTAFGFQQRSFDALRWNRISAGLAYSLSKWTTAYVSGDYLMAPGNTHALIGYDFAPSNMSQQSDIRIGLRVKF